jgi:type I restriction enzyme M protein
MNLLDAVIGLPANLFYGVGIPATILIFKQNRNRNDILFIDASQEGMYEKGKNQNKLRPEDLDRITEAYERYETLDKFTYVANLQEISNNDFNLNIPRYVNTFEEDELIDLYEVKENIESLKKELSEVETKIAKYLDELGI